MFYAHFVLSKKGPLAKVWLAAHWDKKLTKAHVFETDVEKTVDNIISPKVKMALRTSGHLLLGVVRIYSRKQKYLIQDLGEACAKIKMAFRPGVVDLPIEGAVANPDTITLPEIFHDLETAVADLNTLDIDEQMMMHRSRAEEITLKDDFIGAGMFPLEDDFQLMDNEFGGMLEDIEIPRKSSTHDKSNVSDMSQISLPTVDDKGLSDKRKNNDSKENEFGEFGDGFGGFGQGGLQDDLLNMPDLDDINLDQPPPQSNEMEVDGDHPIVPEGDPAIVPEGDKNDKNVDEDMMEVDVPIIPPNDTIRDADEGFVLEPLDMSVRMRQKRKRKLVVDMRNELTGDMIRAQLRDSSDIVQPKLIPPPSKKALLWKEFGVSDYLLNNPTVSSLQSELFYLVCSNLDNDITEDVDTTTLIELEDTEVLRGAEGTVNESTINESIVPLAPVSPTDLNNVPPSDMPLEEERGITDDVQLPPIDDHHDFIDNIDLEGGGDPLAMIIPDMPDLDEANEEGRANLTQSSSGQQSSEKSDEMEQRRWNKRAQQVLQMLEKGFNNSDTIRFTSLTKRCSRKQAASRFYTCLLLGKEGAITFHQTKPYAPIDITTGPLFTQSL